jgi:hypothetical protein
MSATTNEPMLLMINDTDAQVLQDALTLFANNCDRTGDPCNEATHADELWEKLDAIHELGRQEAREIVKAMGLGRYRGRPQG